MQTTQKAGDPSMDEILASIRKIIADDPAAPASPAQPPARAEGTLANQVASPSVSSAPPVKSERRGTSRLDQELAELLREPVDQPNPAIPSAAAAGGTSVLKAPVPVPPAVTMPVADAGDKGAVTGLGGWFRNRPNGTVTGATAVPSDEPAGPINAQHASPPAGAAAATPTVVAAATEALPLSPAANGSAAPVSVQSILNRLGSGAGSAPGSQPAPSPSTVMSRVFASEPMPAGAQFEPPPSAPANRPPVEAPAPPISAEKPAEPVIAGVSEPAAMPAPLPVPAPVPVAEAPVAPPPQQAVATPQKPEPPAAVTQEAVAARTSRAGVVEQPHAPGGAEKSLDDTLAELLRPVVRQWLDENMARALEKAVKIEMADSVKSAMTKLVPGSKI